MNTGMQHNAEGEFPRPISYPLPSDIRFDKQLLPQDLDLLQQQWNIFNQLRRAVLFENPLKSRIREGKPELSAGTLIHGQIYDKEVLLKVKQRGILSGELVGIPEDMETNFCADFFKVPQDFILEDYLKWCAEPKVEGRIRTRKPEGNYLPMPTDRTKHIAFIVDTSDPRLNALLKMDAYNVNTHERMSSIVTHLPYELGTPEADRLAAIMVGIPSNFISGIVVGNKITPEERQEIRDIMGKDVIMYDTFGKII